MGIRMTNGSTLAIEATGLVKTFGDTCAVDGVDLAVPQDSVYGVLGPVSYTHLTLPTNREV